MGTASSPANESAAQPVVPRGGGGRPGVGARVLETLLRVLALLLSMAGALVLAKIRQNSIVTLDNIPITVLARHSYIKAYVFLVYADAIVAIYCLISLLLSFIARRRLVASLLFLMDLVMSYLLLAAAASAAEASYIAKRGQTKVAWGEVCSNISHFCTVVGVSLVLSFLAMIVLGFLVILSGRRLFGRSSVRASSPLSDTQV